MLLLSRGFLLPERISYTIPLKIIKQYAKLIQKIP